MREVLINGEKINFEVKKNKDDSLCLTYEGLDYQLSRFQTDCAHKLRLQINGKNIDIWKSGIDIDFSGQSMRVESTQSAARSSSSSTDESKMTAPMPGKILKIMVNLGDEVKKSQSLLVMEAMKMEHTIKAAQDGVVKSIYFSEGDLVDGGAQLVELEE